MTATTATTAESRTPPLEPRSFLVADCGSVTTTVALFDVAGHGFRLLARASAPTTAGAPWEDTLAGVQQAIAQLSEITGRVLLTQQRDLIRPAQPNGAGVDYFLATVSTGEPLKVLLVALLEDVSLASARRVLRTLYAKEVDSFSLGDSRNQQEQVAAILACEPDLIFIAGGTDGGADERLLSLVETVDIGLSLQASNTRPQVVYAGNTQLREKVSAILRTSASVRVADNVRPTLETEQLEDAMRVVGEIYDEQCVELLPGIDSLLDWSEITPIPTARAFGAVMGYLAALYKGRVYGVDLGANNVTFTTADPQQVRLSVRSDLGMGRPVHALRKPAGIEAIQSWLPEALEPAAIQNYLANKLLQPHTIPATREELYLEQAVARLMMQQAVMDAAADWGWLERQTLLPPCQLLVLRGRTLTEAPRPSQVAAMVLDAIQPAGIFSIVMDRYGILPALGALAAFEPLVPVQVLEAGALVDMGWMVAPYGHAAPGQTVLRGTMDTDKGGHLKIDAKYGSLEVVSLLPGETAVLDLQPSRRFDLGYGPGKGRKITISGGALGLVIDTRGRPMRFERDRDARYEQNRRWLQEMGA